MTLLRLGELRIPIDFLTDALATQGEKVDPFPLVNRLPEMLILISSSYTKFDGEPACNPKAQTFIVLIVIGYAIGHGGSIMSFNKLRGIAEQPAKADNEVS